MANIKKKGGVKPTGPNAKAKAAQKRATPGQKLVPKSAGKKATAKKLRTARGRGTSSVNWLERQLRDPYVAKARAQGYRSRAAFKLMELNDKYRFLKPGKRILDLGAAPGGWSQLAVEKCGAGNVVAVDIQETEPITGAVILTIDFLDPKAPELIHAALKGKADVVLSDMAAPSMGHAQTDHLRIMGLLDAAYDFAREVLSPGGIFVGKVLRGGAEKELLDMLKRDFTEIRHVKPPASRKESAEIYVIALGFKGA
jgi:23S rRNA (uridine2552-2'-O)-methyltransferase